MINFFWGFVMGESQLEKKNSEKKDNSKTEIDENLEESSEEGVKIPKNSLVKFRTCDCGALLEESNLVCWSCGKKYEPVEKSMKGQISDSEKIESNSEESKMIVEISETPEKEADNEYYESEVKGAGYTHFVKCNKCGALNDVNDAITICWSCNNQIDTSQLIKQISNENMESSSIGQKEDKKISELDQSKKEKKHIPKYVLHCTKCNSWFVATTYSPEMTCDTCGTKKSLFVSYTCKNCKKFFDLNKLTKLDCPYCKKPLDLTAEESLF